MDVHLSIVTFVILYEQVRRFHLAIHATFSPKIKISPLDTRLRFLTLHPIINTHSNDSLFWLFYGVV